MKHDYSEHWSTYGSSALTTVGGSKNMTPVCSRVGTGSPGHRVIIVTRYETRIFSNFRTNAQNAQLTF